MRLGQHFGRKLGLERRDVWDMLWSEDDEEMLCIVEKTKMVRYFDEDYYMYVRMCVCVCVCVCEYSWLHLYIFTLYYYYLKLSNSYCISL